jgi:hypothetical protein
MIILDAFSGCSNLQQLYLCNIYPPNIVGEIFHDVPTNLTLYVPQEAISQYRAAQGWNSFRNIEAIPAQDCNYYD